MQLIIAAAGKLKAGPERELYKRYAERVGSSGKALGLGPLAVVEVSESRKAGATQRRDEEAETLLAKIPGSATLVALNETGKAVTSRQFARLLAGTRDSGAADMAFLIGGPDGHGKAVLERAAYTISLGAITLPHGLARAVLAEQLYRAVTILAGHPYHRG